MIVDPKDCAPYIIDCHGAEGRAWLERLPSLVATWARRWSLDILPPFQDLSYNYVAPAIQNGTPVVLKACVPNPELSWEIQALQVFAGNKMVRLLDADAEQGALLLERLVPGTPLTEVDDDEKETQIAAQVMRELWRPVPPDHTFATVAGWAAGLQRLRSHFSGGSGPFPEAMVAAAEGLFEEFVDRSPNPVLIHGDMHHQNILRSEREPWLAIDPKGVVGDPLYDVATFVSSLPRTLTPAQTKKRLARRVDQLAGALGFDRKLIIGWALAQSVLSGWWSFEDHGRGWEPALARAGLYASLA